MGGRSSSQQTQTQSSTTNPWEPAQGALQGILGQLSGNLGQTGVTANESNALNSIMANGANGAGYAQSLNGLASNLMAGGGATAQSGAIQGGFQNLQNQLSPFANGSMVGNNPGLRAQLQQIATDVRDQVNPMFAAGGRDRSGMNQQTLARGIAQGEAPVIAAQYNQDVSNQLGAANALYNGQNTTSGLLAGLNQQGVQNQQAGASVGQQALDAGNYGANATLQAEAARRGIPVQALGLLAQIGIPIAELGGQSTGTGTSNGTQQMSGAQQFALIGNGLGSFSRALFGGR